ncbi:pantoate--beta-alanine ligase [Chryseobacterium indologenes]|uniref:pantoate--beta-alanine ligase n=1 Tax=Chryseobacterium indologenes TaxID=253 RepID=UPI000BFE1EB4|nr:pantoate--beta-alanine ligase [Chryseobacterium indologenes]ATN04123.1 pantoate--beta-alanine ligase [Chryseobacterium indologenes]AYY83213.1 pantoate--beta-alanine ligase [Chryseobacterium indologenes]QIX80116.1 pantoate--beta-alanine ligase [Chryseobacterium indologenes]UDQ53761.1 pantoate--beta-alanine ligase [Chryseobacterium indologenes]HAO29071.1 pantoate--beta-alanine ligase [Chryseobacterium indologenes]
MEVIKNSKVLKDFIERQKEMGKRIGFAPTMGALHKGHLSLYEEARKDNDLVISSIFVNPTQFNNPEDLEKYPRDINRDILILENSGLVDAVYIPEVVDIYPEKAESQHYDYDGLENEMEGKSRPGHFDGVGTVVEELFRQVQPGNAYFGEKDFQQLAIIKKMVEKKHLPVNIKGVPIYRAENGLALSSRNQRLHEDRKETSKVIYETLKKVNDLFRTVSVPEIKERVTDIFDQQQGMRLEYFLIADEDTLKETDFFYKDRNYRAFIVVVVDGVRLIDNMHLD